jgi:PAS domain S-box-containing protein
MPTLPLILARELSANVATPYLVLDDEGTLMFFNERAERIIGATPSELGELREDEWRTRFRVERPDGTPVETVETPSARARRERRPVYDELVYEWEDGRRTPLSVIATPLLGRDDELFGVFLLFWELDRE